MAGPQALPDLTCARNQPRALAAVNGSVNVRSVDVDDESAWERLWLSYCAIYAPAVPKAIAQRTWGRLFDPDTHLLCFVAELDGRVSGIVHCVLHQSTLSDRPGCYLSDLFVEPVARRRGVAHALLGHLKEALRTEGWSEVGWATSPDNTAAIALSEHHASNAEDARRYVTWPAP